LNILALTLKPLRCDNTFFFLRAGFVKIPVLHIPHRLSDGAGQNCRGKSFKEACQMRKGSKWAVILGIIASILVISTTVGGWISNAKEDKTDDTQTETQAVMVCENL
jgi:hypothetical protein